MTEEIAEMETALRLAALPRACEAAGVTYSKAWRWAVGGRLFSLRRGRLLFVDLDELRRLVRQAGASRAA